MFDFIGECCCFTNQYYKERAACDFCVTQNLSHPEISILECELFSKRNSKFLKDFFYFSF